MADQEKYWIEEFYDYAINIKEEAIKKEKEIEKLPKLEAFEEEMINSTDFSEKLEKSLIKLK